jgi:hypothetical protein
VQHVPEGECGEEHGNAADDVKNPHGNALSTPEVSHN